ncbi:hypothetical protein [Mycobacteroides abscessus]|uniref:hypothetical protein n=1 Tax=Mycobacteroides abscessus TaxID=36809 RepID=UPI000C25982F|nr:hypothetical protein [Mycobacteroides abscessus]
MPFDIGHEWVNATNRMLYVTHRHLIIGNVLRKARAGELGQGWRNNLESHRNLEPGESFRDEEILVLRELKDMDVQPWEPNAAGGAWREALDAWYSDTLAIETYYETERFPELPRPPADDDSVPFDWLSWYAQEQGLRAEADAQLAQTQLGRRDAHGASYRAGLMAGGVETDWLGWLQQRIALWDHRQDYPADISPTMVLDYFGSLTACRRVYKEPSDISISIDGFREWQEQLPDYWTAKPRRPN